MGAYQVIMNMQKQILMEKELYSKSQYINTAKTAKVFILLDFVITIYTKSYNITHRNIIVYFDNSKVWKMSNDRMITFNKYNQDRAVEAKQIQEAAENIPINIIF